MQLVSNYMRDDALRHALNDLTKKTFGFDFESWVTGGYFDVFSSEWCREKLHTDRNSNDR